MKEQHTRRSARNAPGRRIEWTGTGGYSYLAVVVDAGEEIMDECWGTRKKIRAWVSRRWPDLPLFYAPMVYSPADTATANAGHARDIDRYLAYVEEAANSARKNAATPKPSRPRTQLSHRRGARPPLPQ